jgi:spore coat protein A, manganese oxidase
MFSLSRRDLLRLGLISAGAAALPAGRLVELAIGKGVPPGDGPTGPASPAVTPFAAFLPIPQPLTPTRVETGADFYDVFMREADIQLLPGRKTRMLTYNEQFPGPMIVATLNRPAIVTYHNGLAVNTTIHNHGEYVSGDSDGHPDDAILPGATKTCFYPNTSEKPADDVVEHTQWFHDHIEHATAFNVYHGLAGLYLFNDPKTAALNLPSGGADIPLVITDKLFNADNSLFYTFPSFDSENGFLGDVIQVNGAPQPRLEVERRKYRFRFLNACDSRNLELALGSKAPLTIIASECGFLESPVSAGSLFMAPAERYEVVVDFARYPVGTKVVLQNLQGGKRTTSVMRFDVIRDAVDTSTVPTHLRTIRRIPEAEATVQRRFVFERSNGQWEINGKTFDGNRIDAQPRVGDTEIWTLRNDSGGWLHPVHIHLLNFQVLDRNGKPPLPQEAGWKETIRVGPDETVRVIMKWPPIPDNGGVVASFRNRYVFHCHNLEHEDHDMMLQLKVID